MEPAKGLFKMENNFQNKKVGQGSLFDKLPKRAQNHKKKDGSLVGDNEIISTRIKSFFLWEGLCSFWRIWKNPSKIIWKKERGNLSFFLLCDRYSQREYQSQNFRVEINYQDFFIQILWNKIQDIWGFCLKSLEGTSIIA